MNHGKGSPIGRSRERHEKLRQDLKSRIDFRGTWKDHFADLLTSKFGTIGFLSLNAAFFLTWILINTGAVPIVPIFDHYPFNFLTMTVSLEAIFLAVIVLISQNRQMHNADIREQIDFEVNVRAEEEISKVLVLLDKVGHHLNIPNMHDAELEEMEGKTDISRILDEVKRDNEQNV